MDHLRLAKKVLAHANKMPARCKDKKTDECMYRGPNGSRCFIGALIPDRLYSKDLEGTSVDMLPDTILTYLGVATEDPDDRHYDIQFLRALQFMHDEAVSIREARAGVAELVRSLEKGKRSG